ncbi:hypothetical protein WH47_04435 [Habropoda laboriosa]|uniref:Uncharacterized protein n=1 Tax=Habropoda laboriosa TaxID=597456 RepID=A0A0L7QWR5_9HYME|nr:hypothetical protein WH47_04435 [Habropoda laboriosa]
MMCIVRYLILTYLRHTTVIDCDKNDDNNYYDDCCITNDDDDDDDNNVILHSNSRCNIEAHPLPTKSMCRCIPDVPRSSCAPTVVKSEIAFPQRRWTAGYRSIGRFFYAKDRNNKAYLIDRCPADISLVV